MKIGYVFLTIGLVLGAVAAFVARKIVFEPQSWPEVDALVVSSTIINPSAGSYTPEFTFRYSVDGVERQRTVRSTTSTSSYSFAESMVGRFRAGTHVPIHVKPGDPDHIAYDTGWSATNTIIVSAIGGLAAIFFTIGLVVVRPARPARSEIPQEFHIAQEFQTAPTAAGTRRQDQFARIGPLVFLGFGLLFLSIAILVGRNTGREKREWPTVDAEVVDTAIVRRSSSGSRSRTLEDLRVRFRYTVDDRVYIRETTTGVARSGGVEKLRQLFAPGTHHQIQYRPGNPNVIRFETGLLDDWFLPGVFGLIGSVFTGLGVLLLRLTRSKNETPQSFGRDQSECDEGEQN